MRNTRICIFPDMKRHGAFAAALFLALPLAVVVGQQPATTAPATAISRANLDTTCAACQNFFEFANGGWLKRATIPPAYTSWGTFNEVSDRNEAIVHQILEGDAVAMSREKRGSNAWKVGAFYAACMDSARIESLGAKPIAADLARIARVGDAEDVTEAFGELERTDGIAPFGIGTAPDMKRSSEVIAVAGQGGLGLPERDYYTRTDARSAQLRQAYVEHVQRMLALTGEPTADAAADAQRVMQLETRLAGASMTRVAMRDPNAVYHKMSLADFQKLTPHIDWTRFLREQHAPMVSDVNVRQPEFFATLDTLVATAPAADWRAYLRWHLANEAAPSLSSAFVDEDFRFRRLLTGAKEELPRWKRCAAQTNRVLGEALGQQYVARTFTPQAKARALKMVDNLRTALREDIQGLGWMSGPTKDQALAKLDAFTRKIGYPDRWRDYSALTIEPDEYAEDLRHANEFAEARNWAKYGKPVDRSEWGMTPPTVNAYYNASMNEIVFPAGILQPPFFNPTADDAVNYGAMGAVIGHEMTHGFDDQGRQFDAQGNLRDWWTPADAAKYTVQANRVAEQFNGYTVVDSSTHVNGRLTLGENIADLGGLTIAYRAMEKALAKDGRPGPIDGFTPEQRFFLAWAQVWRELQRPEAARTQVNTDPHAPGVWRVNGPLSNMPEFRAAWGCKEGDSMVRPDSLRARIW